MDDVQKNTVTANYVAKLKESTLAVLVAIIVFCIPIIMIFQEKNQEIKPDHPQFIVSTEAP